MKLRLWHNNVCPALQYPSFPPAVARAPPALHISTHAVLCHGASCNVHACRSTCLLSRTMMPSEQQGTVLGRRCRHSLYARVCSTTTLQCNCRFGLLGMANILVSFRNAGLSVAGPIASLVTPELLTARRNEFAVMHATGEDIRKPPHIIVVAITRALWGRGRGTSAGRRSSAQGVTGILDFAVPGLF